MIFENRCKAFIFLWQQQMSRTHQHLLRVNRPEGPRSFDPPITVEITGTKKSIYFPRGNVIQISVRVAHAVHIVIRYAAEQDVTRTRKCARSTSASVNPPPQQAAAAAVVFHRPSTRFSFLSFFSPRLFHIHRGMKKKTFDNSLVCAGQNPSGGRAGDETSKLSDKCHAGTA